MPAAPSDPTRLIFRLGLAFVAVAALASALAGYQHHAARERGLWASPSHDRNAHYRFGVEMAADIRTGNVIQLGIDFEKGSIVWPPLHGMLLAAVLLVGGGNPTLAVAPSLIGWAAGAVFAYLAANRAAPRFGPLAGVVAAGLVLASPAFRAFAADCMLESLGAGLTLAVLFAYLRWEQDRTRHAALWLGLALSLLFFEKYNYWLLAAQACGLAHVLSNWSDVRATLTRLRGLAWKPILVAQLRRPLNYLIAVAGGVCVSQWFGGKPGSLFVTIAFALVLLRFSVWWWFRGGRVAARAWLGEARYPLVYSHLVPVSLWLLVPLRLTTLVWFLSPANTERVYHETFADTAAFYWDGFAREYVGHPAGAWAVAGLATVALAGAFWPRAYRRAGWVVPAFAAGAVLLTLRHPNHKLRFLFTAAAGMWATAGLGVAFLAARFPKPWAGWAVGGALAGGLAFTLFPLADASVVSERGHAADPASLRDLTDLYLDATKPTERVALFGSHTSKFWVKWSWLEAGRAAERVQFDYREAGAFGPLTPELFARWCEVTKCEVLVFIEIEPGSPLDEATAPGEGHAELRELLPKQTTFLLATVHRRPGRGTVSVWRRIAPAGTPAPAFGG